MARAVQLCLPESVEDRREHLELRMAAKRCPLIYEGGRDRRAWARHEEAGVRRRWTPWIPR